MAFIYDREKYRAVDPEIGAEVREDGHILDSTEIFPYTFTRNDMRLELGAVPRQRLVEYINEKTGQKTTQRVDCVFYIPESMVMRGVLSYRSSKKIDPRSAREGYEELKRQICEGLFVLETQRGAANLLKLIPDFSVQIVDAKSIPQKDALLHSKPETKKDDTIFSKLTAFLTKKRAGN